MRQSNNLWSTVVHTGTQDLEPTDAALGITKGINLFSLWIILINIIFGPAYFFATGKVDILIGSLMEAAFLVGLVYLNYRRKRLMANMAFYFVLNAATFYFSAIIGQLGEAQLMIVFMVGLAMFMFTNRMIRGIAITFSIVLLIVMEINFKYKVIPSLHASENKTDLMRWTAEGVIIFLVSMLFYMYAREKSKLLAEVQKYSAEVETDLEHQTKLVNIKTAFIKNAYHEVRTSFKGMFVLVGEIKKMEKDALVMQIGDLTDVLANGCNNLHMLLTNILEWSKMEAGVHPKVYLEPFNLKITIQHQVDLFQYAASERNLKLRFDYSSDIPNQLISDKLKIIQILINLVHNSLKFAERGTFITILLVTENDNWKLSITDQGKGMTQEQLAKIFHPFESDISYMNQQGVGLGLTITSQLVALLHGSISAESELDKGSTFTVLIPIIDPDEFYGKTVDNKQNYVVKIW